MLSPAGVAKLFPDEPELAVVAGRPRPGLFVIAAVHALIGGYGLVRAGIASFDGPWVLAAPAGAVLVAHALLLAFRRRPSVYTFSRVLVALFRVGGGIAIIMGAMAMREHMAGAYEVMGVGLVIGLWGIWLGSLLDHCEEAFVLPGAPASIAAEPPPPPDPVPRDEVDALVVRLSEGMGNLGRQTALIAYLIGALFAGLGLLFGLAHGAWDIAAAVGGFGAALFALLWFGARRLDPARMRPVLDDLRHHPGRIVSIRHYSANRERGYMIREFVEVKTDTHRLVVRADHDWPQLMDRLGARCPQARRKG